MINLDNKKISVSIIMPFYNEEAYIPYSLDIINKTLRNKIEYEIILVNDGSTDRSRDIALQSIAEIPQAKVIDRKQNGGLGAALRSGFTEAQKDFILYTDIDMPFDFKNEFWRILSEGHQVDLCFGQRISKKQNLKRQLYSRGFNWLMQKSFSIENDDINFAMKLIRRDKLNLIKLYSDGSFIDCELYLKSLFSGFEMKAISIEYQERLFGQSHLGNLKNIIKLMKEFIWLFPELYKMSRNPKVI